MEIPQILTATFIGFSKGSKTLFLRPTFKTGKEK